MRFWLRLGVAVLIVLVFGSLGASMRFAVEAEQPIRRLAQAPLETTAATSIPSPLHPSPPPPPPPPPPPELVSSQCYAREHVEYDGAGVAIWGDKNLLPNAADCCASCRAHRQRMESSGRADQACLFWVHCSAPGGCSGGQKEGACWGKTGFHKKAPSPTSQLAPTPKSSGAGCGWTSGAVYSPAEAEAVAAEVRGQAEALSERRDRPGNPRVWLDVQIEHKPAGRIEFVLYMHEAPRAAENFRAMCTPPPGGGSAPYTGMSFYRILDQFIDQAGGPHPRWGTPFDDDPGGLALKHDRPGLLSAANSGPNTNSGHFSIVVAPAPHLNGEYTIFGEVVAGFDTMWAINRLAPPGATKPTGKATVSAAGCTAHCEPRDHISPKCKTRAAQASTQQGKPVRRCLD